MCALFNRDIFSRNLLSAMKYENCQVIFIFSHFIKTEFWCW